MAAILKIEKSQYLQKRLANFDEIMHDDTYFSTPELTGCSKIKDGGRAPL